MSSPASLSTPPADFRSASQTGWVHVAVLAAYGLLTVIMTWPLAANLTSAIPGDGFDGWQNYWNLWWVKLALIDRVQNPLITDILYHPTGVGLYFHTLNPFNGLATLPIQLSAGLLAAYNAVVFLSWILGGYGVFLLTRWILAGQGQRSKSEEQGSAPKPMKRVDAIFDLRSSIRYFSAFLAGAIFTFAPFHMAHLLGHMQVMSLQWIAFYILALLMAMRNVRDGKPWLRRSAMAGLFLVFTGLCDWYFVLYLLFFTIIVLGWAGIRILLGRAGNVRSNDADPSVGKRLRLFVRLCGPPLVAGAIFVVALSPWLVPMVRQTLAYSFMVRPQSDLYILSASAMDFLVPNRLHTLFRPESFAWIGNQVAPVSERTISIGYVTLALALVGLATRPRRASLWAITALVFFALALGPIIHWGNITWAHIPDGRSAQLHLTPMGILNYYLPIARISRSVSRFALMVQLSMAVLAGLGTSALLSRLRTPRAAAIVGGLLLALVLAEFWVAPYPLSAPDTPAYYGEALADGGEGAVLNLPMNYDRPGYLLYQTVHQRPLAVAYISRDDPRTLTERLPVLQHWRHLGPDIIDADAAAVGQTVLSDMGVETVVLDRYKMPGGEERDYTTALAEAVFAGVEPVYEDDRLTVYHVTRPAEPAPYLALGEEGWGPLNAEQSGSQARGLNAEAADISIHHAAEGSGLRIRYQTEPDVGIVISVGGGDPVSTLPAAPDGNEVIVDGDLLGITAADDVTVVTLTASAADGVWIEALALVVPSD